MRVVVDVKNGEEFVTASVPSVKWAVYKAMGIPGRLRNTMRRIRGRLWQDRERK